LTVLQNLIVLTSKKCTYFRLASLFHLSFSNNALFLLDQWTDERSNLHETTIKSLLQVKVNLDHSCREMHRVISTSKALLKNIIFGEKYGTK